MKNYKMLSMEEPETSNITYFDLLPAEIIEQIDRYLHFEDSCNFQRSTAYISAVLERSWQYFDRLQISDDENDCLIQCSREHVAPRLFVEQSLPNVLTICKRIDQVVIIIKDFNSQFHGKQSPRSVRECSLYHQNGFLGYFFSLTSLALKDRLTSISLHVDIMFDTFAELWYPCPIEDLCYCVTQLTHANFETFVQVSYCVATFLEEDLINRNILISGMEIILKEMANNGAKTDFSIDVNEGYVDMTVEKGNFEYSFAFFYYNPMICASPSVSKAEDEKALNTNGIGSVNQDR